MKKSIVNMYTGVSLHGQNINMNITVIISFIKFKIVYVRIYTIALFITFLDMLTLFVRVPLPDHKVVGFGSPSHS